MALKVQTLGGFQGSTAKDQKKIQVNTLKKSEYNQGSALGYMGQRLGIGVAGIFEGFGDFVSGSVYQLAGDKAYAKYLHDRDVTGGWQERLDASYNPSRGMQIAGDIASGVGQALPSVAVGIATGGGSAAVQAAGAIGIGAAYAGRGVTSAVQKTGELGTKENVYGVLSGMAEGATDTLLGGAQKAGKALWTVGKTAAKSAGTKIARNGLIKGMLSSASSEFAEEFFQEYIDAGLLRVTGVDKDASVTLGDALYSGMIGGITGGLLGGATGSINAANNIRRGESIRARGLESNLLATANYIRNDYLGKGANFDHIQSPSLRTLSAAVDAYAELEGKGRAKGTHGAMLLGEIQAGTLVFEVETGIRSRMESIMANPTEDVARYASAAMGKTVTVEDLRKNVDGVAEQIAVRNFTMDLLSESKTEKRVTAIREKVASERYAGVREAIAWNGQLPGDGSMVFRAPSGQYVIVTADEADGHEGAYRVGFSETENFDPDHIKYNENVSLTDLKKGFAGLANGSMVIGKNRLEASENAKNAPASGEGVNGGQVSAETANGAQRGENQDESGQIRRLLSEESQNSSIKEQLRAHLSEVNAMSPVAKINYSPSNKLTIREKVGEVFKKFGYKVDRKGFGIIEIGEKQIRKSMNYLSTDGELAALLGVPHVLKRGIDISGHGNHKGRSFSTVTFAAPVEINGVVGNVAVVVQLVGKNNYHTHRILMPDGSEFVFNNKTDAEPRNAGVKGVEHRQGPAISSASNASIPQNGEKSTLSDEKNSSTRRAISEKEDSRKDPKTGKYKKRTEEKVMPRKQKKAAKKKAEQMALDAARREQSGEKGDSLPQGVADVIGGRGYTDEEANAARKLVKDFDLLLPDARRAIVELYRSGEACGAAGTFMRHAANLIAYWRRGLWIIADDKIRDDGFFYVFDDGTRLITVKPSGEGRSITEAFMHELGHDVWERADKETRKKLYRLAVDGVDKADIKEIRERYRRELTKRGESVTIELLYEEVFANLLGRYIGTDEFLPRFGGGDVSVWKRLAKTLSVMKNRFTGKDKYLYRKADDLFRAFSQVMAGQAVTSINVEKMHVSGKTKYSIGETENGKPVVVVNDDITKYVSNDKELVKLVKESIGKLPYVALGKNKIWFVSDTKREVTFSNYTKWLRKNAPAMYRDKMRLFNHPSEIILATTNYVNEGLVHPRKDDIIDFARGEVLIDILGNQYSAEVVIGFTKAGICELHDVVRMTPISIKYKKRNALSTISSNDEHLQKRSSLNNSIAQNSQKSTDSAKKVSENNGSRRSALPNAPYSYDTLVGKPDLKIVRLKRLNSEKVEQYDDDSNVFVSDMMKLAKKAGNRENSEKKTYLYCEDLEKNIMIGRESFRHGAARADADYYRVCCDFANILRHSIAVNELVAREGTNGATVLLGMAETADRYVYVRTVVENRTWRVEDYDIVYAIRKQGAKKEDVSLKAPGLRHGGGSSSSSVISIADFLQNVKSEKIANEVFSKDVAEKLGVERAQGSLSSSLRFALPKDVKMLSGVALNEADRKRVEDYNAALTEYRSHRAELKGIDGELKMLRARMKKEALSQEEQDRRAILLTRKKLLKKKLNLAEHELLKMEALKPIQEIIKKERAAARKDARTNGAKRVQEKMAAIDAEIDSKATKKSNEYSKLVEKITNDVMFLKHIATHKKATDGGSIAPILLEDPSLRALVSVFSKRASAYGLMHKSTREGIKAFLPWYREDNEILRGNAIDEILSQSPQSVSNVFGYYNADIRERMERIANGEGAITESELSDLAEVVNAVARLYMTYGKVYCKGKWVDSVELAEKAYNRMIEARRAMTSGREADGTPAVILQKLWHKVHQSYIYGVVTPEVVLRDLEYNVKDGVLSSLYHDIRLGEADARRVRAKILTPVAEFFSEHRRYRRELSTKRRIEFKGYQLTAAQAVGLWETSLREQAQQRMFDNEKGGVRFAVYDESTGKTDTKKVKVTRTDIDNLWKQFSEEDKGYIKALEKSFALATKYKEKTDAKIWGFTNVVRGHYYPITTDPNYFSRDVTDIRDTMSTIQVVNNKSFNKNTVEGAQAWLFIEDSLKVLEWHSMGVGSYTGLFQPLQTFGRVYGARFDPTGMTAKVSEDRGIFVESVVEKTSLREVFGDRWSRSESGGGLDRYLTRLFSDIQGIVGEKTMVDRVVAKLQSAYITSTFGLNAKILFTQLASYFSAQKNLDIDILARAVTEENSKIAWREQGELMDKYSRLTFARSFDGVGAAEGLLDSLSEVGRFATKGIDFTDRGVLIKLFVACQMQVEKNGGGAMGEESNLKAAGAMLDELLLDTQTTSLKSDASSLMRSDNMVAKMVTMFRTESMKSFSNFYTAVSAFVNHRRFRDAGIDGYDDKVLAEDKKRIGKTATSFLMSASWVAAISVLFSRIRKWAKGEDEEEAVLEEGAKEVAGNIIELVPVFSELYSFMADGYEMESIPVSVINDGLSMLKNMNVLFDSEATEAEWAKYLRQSVYTVGSITGLPTKNLGRIALTVTSAVNRRTAYLSNDRFKTNPTYKSDLDRALESGNARLSETVLSAWFERQKGGAASREVAEEILRLYVMTDEDGKSIFTMPKSVPSTLDTKQRAAFSSVYAEADTALSSLISSKAYKALSDVAKAKAIKACYDMAWSRAAISLGLEDVGSAATMASAEGADTSVMAAVAGFAKAYAGKDRKAQITDYLKTLGLDARERAVYLSALGYKTN